MYIYTYIHTYIHTHIYILCVSTPSRHASCAADAGLGGVAANNSSTETFSGLEVSPLKVSGGFPVHLRSKNCRNSCWKRPSGSKKKQ